MRDFPHVWRPGPFCGLTDSVGGQSNAGVTSSPSIGMYLQRVRTLPGLACQGNPISSARRASHRRIRVQISYLQRQPWT